MVNQIALHIFSPLEDVNSNPIVLGWCDKETQVKPVQVHKNCQLKIEQITKWNRKLLITRRDDFLWET